MGGAGTPDRGQQESGGRGERKAECAEAATARSGIGRHVVSLTVVFIMDWSCRTPMVAS
jgi:hypothetical protein